MNILGIGKGIQDHSLSRKHAPPTDDELTNRSNKSRGKMLLDGDDKLGISSID